MDLDRIEKLVQLLEQSRAGELRVEADGWRFVARRGSARPAGPVPLSPPPAPEPLPATRPPDPALLTITAPLVGIFRQGEARLMPGERVAAGAPVGGIESMKILNPVVAAAGGEIEEVLVEDGQPVEYGQALLLMRPLPEEEEET